MPPIGSHRRQWAAGSHPHRPGRGDQPQDTATQRPELPVASASRDAAKHHNQQIDVGNETEGGMAMRLERVKRLRVLPMVASLVSATDGPAVPAWVPVAR